MPFWRRWWFRIVCLLLLAVAGKLVHVYWQRWQAAEEMRQAVVELDASDPDWRLERIEANRQAIPDKENGALAVIAVFEQLPAEWKTRVFVYDPSRARQPNEDLIKTPPPLRYRDELVVPLRKDLDSMRPALTTARKLIDFRQGRFPVEYTPDFISTLVPNHQGARA